MSGTDSILLNGQWEYIADPGNKLSYERLLRILKRKRTKKIRIPVNWELAGLHNFSGTVWLIRRFKVSTSASKLKILEFKGVDYFADVWLNDQYLGNHEGYFQSFYFDATKALSDSGLNILVVRVSSPMEEPERVWPDKKQLIRGIFNHHDCRPGGWSLKSGQDMNTGGIWNDVILHLTEKVFVESLKVAHLLSIKRDSAVLHFSLSCYSKEALIYDSIKLTLRTPSGKKLIFIEEIKINKGKQLIGLAVEIKNPELWWSRDLGKPNLYELNISGKFINVKKVIFGIREVGMNEKREFFLNGKRLFLRGTNIIPSQFLSELSQNKISRQVTLVREANINIIRMHAHVNRQEYYDECDRQGILVWQDFALQWTYDDSDKFRTKAVAQIKEMVNLLYNHPSIAFWCCHNEPGKQIDTLDKSLYDAVLSIDKSRIVRKASNYEEHPYDGWYWGRKEHFAARPMGPLVTEFGAQSLPVLSSLKKIIPGKDLSEPSRESWAYHDFQYEQTFNVAEVNPGRSLQEFVKNSQNYQSDLLRTAIDFYRGGKNKDITGIFQFMFIDCWPSVTWSVIDYFEKEKKGYFTLQKVFQPVYVLINLKQKKYNADAKLNIDYRIVNDYHKRFNRVFITFRISGKILYNHQLPDITEDSITENNHKCDQIKLPAGLRAGKCIVNVELKSNRNIISVNDFEIEIVKKNITLE